jgi:hypothetical protein
MSRRAAQIGSIIPAILFAGCYYQPQTETQLIQTFGSHRQAFDKLLAMAVADRKFRRVSGGEVPPVGMSESRFGEYLAIFRELGVQSGTDWGLPFYPEGLFVIASSCVPMFGKGQAVGYAYLPARPKANIETRLPISGCPIQIHRGSGHRLVFRPMQDGWYLFYELEW